MPFKIIVFQFFCLEIDINQNEQKKYDKIALMIDTTYGKITYLCSRKKKKSKT